MSLTGSAPGGRLHQSSHPFPHHTGHYSLINPVECPIVVDRFRNKFRAYDKMTGEMVHEIELPANQTGNPMTYMLDGKQYIVMAIGARGHPAELVALTLP